MRIGYPQRSSFEAPIRAAIGAARAQLSKGLPVAVRLPPGGYEGKVVVIVDPRDDRSFQSDWGYPDPSRFPARIRAASKALFLEGQFGSFAVSHSNGILQIRRVVSVGTRLH
jgi:hypothetical protein